MKFHKLANILSTTSAALLLAACGGSGGTSSGNASLSLGLVDAAVDDAQKVLVYIKGVQMHSPEGEDIAFQFCADEELVVETLVEETTDTGETPVLVETDVIATEVDADTELAAEESPMSATCQTPKSREIDLLKLTDGRSVDLLDGVSVPAGKYPWIRLMLDENQPSQLVQADGHYYELTIPSGAQTGLKLNSGFTATINGANDFLIDFDLRKSVHKSGGGYKLRPTLRLIKLENAANQRLTGDWDSDAMESDCAAPMAYVFEGHSATPVDLGSAEGEPVTTAKFDAKSDGTGYHYQVDYLDYGDYTIAYTCKGDLDNPAIAGEVLDFVDPPQNVTVGG